MGLEVILFVISTAVSVVSAVQAKKKAAAAREASLGQDVRVTNSAEPLDIHYGRIGTSGVRTLVATTHNHKAAKFNGTRIGSSLSDVTNGKKNEYLATEVAIGMGEITEIETVWTDDQKYNDKGISGFSTSYWNPPGISNASSAMATPDGRNGAVYYGGQIKASSTFTGLTHAVNIYKLDREEPQFSGAPQPLYFIKKGVKVRTITPPGAEATSTAAAGHATLYTITRNLADTEDLLSYNNTVAYVLLDYLTNSLYGLNWKLYTEAEKAADATLIDDVDLEAFYKAYLICNEVVQGTDSVLFAQTGTDLDGPLPAATPLEVEYPTDYSWEDGVLTYQGQAVEFDWEHMDLNGTGLSTFSFDLNGWLDGLGQPTGISSTEAILRYEYNGSISTGANHRGNVSAIIGVIPGVEFFRSPTGQWKLVVPNSMTPVDNPDGFVADTDYTKFNKVVFTPTTGLTAGIASVYELLVATSQDSPDTTRTNWARLGTAMEPALYDSGATYSSGDVVKYSVLPNAPSEFAGTTGLYVYISATDGSANPQFTSIWRRVAYQPYKIQKVGTIDESELTADLAISYPDSTDKYNQLDVRFPNINKQYADDTITFPPEGSGIHKQFLAQDNEKDLKDLYDIRGLIDAFHAKAWASNKVRQSRREIYEFETRPSGFLYEPGDILKLEDSAAHFGNNAIYVKVLTTKVKPNLSVKFSAIRFFPSDYGWELAGLPTLENRVTIDISDVVPTFPALNSSGFPDSNFDLTDTGTSREVPLTWVVDEDSDVGMYQVVIETQQRATPNAQEWTTLVTLPSSIASYTHVIGDSAGVHWYRIYGVTTDQRKIGPTDTIATYGKAQVGERSAVITTTMTSSTGTVFRDSTGSTVLTMNVFLDGVLSTNHDDYSYSWQITNSSGDEKVITVSDTLPASGFPLLLDDTVNGGPLLSIGDPSTPTGRAEVTAPTGSNGVPADTLSTETIDNTEVKGGLRHLTVGAEDVFSFQQFTCLVGDLPD